MLGRERRPLITYSLTGRQPYSSPLFHSPFLFAPLSFPSCLVEFKLNSLPSFLRRKFFKTNCFSYKFCCLTDTTFLFSISHQMILLALAKAAAILKISSINTKRTAMFLHSLPTVNYLLPRGETIFHLPPINNLEIFKEFSSTTRKYSKTFSPANCLSRKSSAPENIQRLFRLQIVLAANHQLYPENIQRPSGQQAAATTSSSNQQQRSAARTSSRNQQPQPAAATSSSNQQQQLATTISIHPTSDTYTINDDLH